MTEGVPDDGHFFFRYCVRCVPLGSTMSQWIPPRMCIHVLEMICRYMSIVWYSCITYVDMYIYNIICPKAQGLMYYMCVVWCFGTFDWIHFPSASNEIRHTRTGHSTHFSVQAEQCTDAMTFWNPILFAFLRLLVQARPAILYVGIATTNHPQFITIFMGGIPTKMGGFWHCYTHIIWNEKHECLNHQHSSGQIVSTSLRPHHRYDA